MARKSTDTEGEETDRMDERFRKPFFLVTFTVVALLLVMVFAYLLSNSVPLPPESADEDQLVWLSELSNSTWTIDSSTKKEELMELSFHTVTSLSFSQLDREKSEIRCFLDTPEMVISAKVVKGDSSLLLLVDGFELELWYTENGDGEFRTLTLKGRDSWLFFTLDK